MATSIFCFTKKLGILSVLSLVSSSKIFIKTYYKLQLKFLIKVALHTKRSTFHESSLQYGDLNILWNCLYRSNWFYFDIAQWFKALVLWTIDPEFNPPETFKIIFWKLYFSKKFVHSYLLYVTCTLCFILNYKLMTIYIESFKDMWISLL